MKYSGYAQTNHRRRSNGRNYVIYYRVDMPCYC